MTPALSYEVNQMREPSRRRFLKCGLGVCSAGAMIRPISAQSPVVPYYKAVFDERFEDACVLATEASARAIPTVAIRGDITSLFYDDLDLRWKQGPVWLAGLTTQASLFCLHLLARDRGMRLRRCLMKPRIEAALDVLDGALPRGMRMHVRPSDPGDLVFWIIAPGASASAKETANA